MSTPIWDLPAEEALQILKSICNKIYIARNISLNNDSIIEQLKEIDKLFKSDDKFQ